MSLMTVMIILTMFSFTILICFTFAIFKGIGFKNMWVIFRAKTRIWKGFGMIKVIHQTGVPEVLVHQFDGKEFLKPFGDKKGVYLFKSHCLMLNEFGVPMITFRKEDAEPIDPKTGLQTVTSPLMLEEIMARAIKAEQTVGNGIGDWLKDNWKTVGLGILMFIGGFLFVYMHMSDAIVQAGQSASQTIILNASSLGK